MFQALFNPLPNGTIKTKGHLGAAAKTMRKLTLNSEAAPLDVEDHNDLLVQIK